MSNEEILLQIIRHISVAYKPLAEAAKQASDGSGIVELVKELGWDLSKHEDLLPIDLETLTRTLELSYDIIQVAINGLDNFEQFLELMENVADFVEVVKNLDGLQLDLTDIPPEVPDEIKNDIQDSFAQLGKRLLDFLIITYLQREFPVLHNILALMGVIRMERQALVGPRQEHIAWWIEWNHLLKLFTAPEEVFGNVYGWGKPEFDPYTLFRNIRNVLWFLNIPAGLQYADPEGGGTLDPAHDEQDPILRMPILWHKGQDSLLQLGAALLPIRDDNGVNYEGVALIPFGIGEIMEDIGLRHGWSIILGVTSSVNVPFGLLLRPGGNLEAGVLNELDSLPDIGLSIEVSKKKEGGTKIILFGKAGGTRLEVTSVGLKSAFQVGQREPPEYYVETYLDGAKIVIEPSDGDGFIQKILPSSGFASSFNLTVGWTSLEGLYFKGSAGLEVTIPIHRSLGPIKFESIYLKLVVGDDGNLHLISCASICATIGPVGASVERVGVETIIKLAAAQKTRLRFKPPLGAGLVVDAAGLVIGGGYLEIDTENERYAGILQLKIGEIALVAIGLITTRMPDGKRGFSMLVIIAVEFMPPITLPYNFTLSGVGGLIGINRSMIVAAIQAGIKKRTIDSILFPSDPIQNAPKIISDLRAIFPPTEGQFVIGPMVIIGWSTPNLIRAEIGILIQLPDPINIALVGQLVSELPTKDQAIVELHIDVLGIIDFAKGSVSIDAVIYDSRILAFSLTGDMAMRLRWANNPTLAISFGGLNPCFKIANFPNLSRITLSLGVGNNPRISLECYLALTSNTTQFGARLELYASQAGFTIQGHLSFDTLIIFVPFSFTTDIGGSIEVLKGSRSLLTANLDMTLSGPTPWHAQGKVKFKLLFVKVSLKFDKKWGRREKESLPPTDPWLELKAALENPGNWAGLPPGQAELAVSLGPATSSVEILVVHSHGYLEIKQRVLPLNMKLEKMGNASISGDDEFRITEVTVGSGRSLDLAPVKDHFGRAQFLKLSDKEALSLPSYELLDAGVRAGSEAIACGPAVSCELTYETEVIDENKVPHKETDRPPLNWTRGQALLAQSASALAPARHSGLGKYKQANLTPKISLQEEGYAIVSNKNLKQCAEINGNGGGLTYSQASRKLKDHLNEYPEKAEELQIVPDCEVAL